ncbi:MAG: VTC domain-containing protein, partial [Planctomycetota bacterium]
MIGDFIKRITSKKASVVPIQPVAQKKKLSQSAENSLASTVEDAAPIDRTIWCGYEMKYVISEAKTAAIQEFIRPYLGLDRYSKLQPDGFYPIVSLYLDSDNMQLCIESLRGILKRFKLRIRSYSDNPDYPRFFEIKRRSNRVIIKSRARVQTADVPTLLSGIYLPPIGNNKKEIEALQQFQLYMRSVHAKPKVLIRYNRCAHEGKMHNRVRVTFDKKLCYKVT